MASGYVQQSIIHSKHARVEKKKGELTFGRLIKGNLGYETGKSFRGRSQGNAKDIVQEIEFLPKTKGNIARKMNRTGLPSTNMEHIVFMESGVYPSIYFKKTTLRNVLKEFVFPDDVKALPPNDNRTPLIYQIVSNLFNEINFYIFNILVGQNSLTNSFFIFFSDSETIPYSKCCNAPVYIELTQNGSGKILCNSQRCKTSSLAEFLINFEDGRKLWKNLRYFAQASEKDKYLRTKISRLINNGKYKNMNLIDIVQETSRQIVQIFYNSKRNRKSLQQFDDEDLSGPFLTGPMTGQAREPQENQQNQQQRRPPEQSDNFEHIPVPSGYFNSTYSEYQSKISQGLVNEGMVFHKDFDLIRKIDAHILDKKRTRNTTRLNFPRIMSEFHKEKKSMSTTYDKIKDKSMSTTHDKIKDIKNLLNNSGHNASTRGKLLSDDA